MNTQTTIETLRRIILQKQAVHESAAMPGASGLTGADSICNELSELRNLLHASGMNGSATPEFLNQCLLQTSNRLLHVAGGLDYGICISDELGRMLYINQHCCDLFHLSVKPIECVGQPFDYIGGTCCELVADKEAFIARREFVLEKREAVRGEQWKLINGRTISVDYNPIRNGSVFLGHVWIYKDITERVETERKLDEQRLFFEDVLNNIPSDVVVLNPKREYLFVNGTAIKDPEIRRWIIGKTDEEYFELRKHPEELLHKRRAIIGEVLSTRQLCKWEEKFVLEDGSVKYHMRYMYPLLDDAGEVKSLIGYGMDITDHKKIGEQTKRSEKRYRDIFNYSQALICTHDLHGRLISVNPAICNILEYREEEMVGRLISDFIPDDHSRNFDIYYLEPLLQEGKFKGVFCVESKSGQRIYLLFKNYKVDEEGLESYIIGFSQDITDRVESEKQLLLAKKISEDTARAKETFLANMSHEIRTPMNGVLGFASLLVKTDLDEQQMGYLKMIQESANNLLLIVNDVLDLEKILMGKLKFEHIDFPISERVEMCVQSFTYKAEEKGVALKTNICLDREIGVIGDPYRLSQVLNNLISNAIKFTDKGSVVVSASVHNSTDAFLWLEFAVTDTGIGIPADKHKEIFEPFMQANSAVTRKYGGTGLGLSICRELIQLMGGQLFLESEPGKGSTFRFILPFGISVFKPKHKNMSQEIDFKSLGKRRILVAEDVELNQYLARHIMESWGFEVDIAVNGREALNKVQQGTYDLVLMDIQMPEMDGMEATQHIRALGDRSKSGIPIVALTANALKGDSEKYMAVGMNDYLSKPFDESRLFLVISKNIDGVPPVSGASVASAGSAALAGSASFAGSAGSAGSASVASASSTPYIASGTSAAFAAAAKSAVSAAAATSTAVAARQTGTSAAAMDAADLKYLDLKNSDLKHTDPNHTDSNHIRSNNAGTNNVGSNHPGLNHAGSANSGSNSKFTNDIREMDAAKPEEKLYNLTMVEAISGGDQDFVKRMLQLFLDTMPESLRDMKACVQHERWDALSKLAHKLKSTIDSMGITQLKQVVRIIESHGKTGANMDEIPALVDKLIDLMQACMMQVKKDFSL